MKVTRNGPNMWDVRTGASDENDIGYIIEHEPADPSGARFLCSMWVASQSRVVTVHADSLKEAVNFFKRNLREEASHDA